MAIKKRKCEHVNVQEYTECCCDCGVNTYSREADDQWIYWDDETGERIYDLHEHIKKMELEYANKLHAKLKKKKKKS